jgi:hypothetical protein
MHKVAPSGISINPLYMSNEQLIEAVLVKPTTIAMDALKTQFRLHAAEEQRIATRRKEQSEALAFQVKLFRNSARRATDL